MDRAIGGSQVYTELLAATGLHYWIFQINQAALLTVVYVVDRRTGEEFSFEQNFSVEAGITRPDSEEIIIATCTGWVRMNACGGAEIMGAPPLFRDDVDILWCPDTSVKFCGLAVDAPSACMWAGKSKKYTVEQISDFTVAYIGGDCGLMLATVTICLREFYTKVCVDPMLVQKIIGRLAWEIWDMWDIRDIREGWKWRAPVGFRTPIRTLKEWYTNQWWRRKRYTT